MRACIRRATASLFPLLTLSSSSSTSTTSSRQTGIKRVVKSIQYLLHWLYHRRSSRLARSIYVDPYHCPVPLSAPLARSAAARCLIKRTQRPSESLPVSRRPSVRITLFISTANLLRYAPHCPVGQQRFAGLTSPAVPKEQCLAIVYTLSPLKRWLANDFHTSHRLRTVAVRPPLLSHSFELRRRQRHRHADSTLQEEASHTLIYT